MAQLGEMTLLLALALAVYSAVGSVLGQRLRIPPLVESARYATYLTVLPLSVATATLVAAFLSHEFQIQYVFLHSNLAMAPQYTWVALYAGNEGSLLFIALVMSVLCALAIAFASRRLQASLTYATSVLMVILTFFLTVLVFLANPFAQLPSVATDGQGINPLLAHPGMFIHPPMLMIGLVAVSIPFSFAMGSLLAGRVDDTWVDAGRTWGLVAWAVLGSGLLLGAWWAYTILGWGGYWGWDPVENAGLMPWLALTAFIHSIMVQKRRGMFRMWNITLVNIAFGLSLFGMFVNRGGPVPSVHSFGQSTLGWVFLAFMVAGIVVPFAVFFYRFRSLKSARSLESSLSREAAFLVNNLLFLAVAFVTLWGVVFPLISEVFTGETITVGAPFYNKVNGPILLAVIFLMGVGPLLPWRHASWAAVRKALLLPGSVALGLALLLFLVGVQKPLAVLAFALCALVATSILQEWARGTYSRHRRGENFLLAFVRLIAGNRPRYGGYIVHLAVIALALGVTGSGFYAVQRDVSLAPGQETSIGSYTIQYLGAERQRLPDRMEVKATVLVYQGDTFRGTLHPWRAFYPDFNMSSTRAGIRSTPVEDLYIVPGEFREDGQAVFRILVNPLVWWMWIAGPVLILGTLVALWPQRLPERISQRRLQELPAPSPATAGD